MSSQEGGARRRSRTCIWRWRTIWRSISVLNKIDLPGADQPGSAREIAKRIIRLDTVTPTRLFRQDGPGVAAIPAGPVVVSGATAVV